MSSRDRWLGATRGRAAAADGTATFLALMEVQRWRLAMFASDGWFWDEPVRTETFAVLRAAAWAARRMDGLAGPAWSGVSWPTSRSSRRRATASTGAEIYRRRAGRGRATRPGRPQRDGVR